MASSGVQSEERGGSLGWVRANAVAKSRLLGQYELESCHKNQPKAAYDKKKGPGARAGSSSITVSSSAFPGSSKRLWLDLQSSVVVVFWFGLVWF